MVAELAASCGHRVHAPADGWERQWSPSSLRAMTTGFKLQLCLMDGGGGSRRARCEQWPPGSSSIRQMGEAVAVELAASRGCLVQALAPADRWSHGGDGGRRARREPWPPGSSSDRQMEETRSLNGDLDTDARLVYVPKLYLPFSSLQFPLHITLLPTNTRLETV